MLLLVFAEVRVTELYSVVHIQMRSSIWSEAVLYLNVQGEWTAHGKKEPWLWAREWT